MIRRCGHRPSRNFASQAKNRSPLSITLRRVFSSARRRVPRSTVAKVRLKVLHVEQLLVELQRKLHGDRRRVSKGKETLLCRRRPE